MLLGPIIHLSHKTDRFMIGWDMLVGLCRFMIGCDMSRERSVNLCSIPSAELVLAEWSLRQHRWVLRSRDATYLCRQAKI